MKVKIGKNETELDDKKLARAVEDFCEIKAQIDALNENLKGFKDEICTRAREILSDNDATTLNLFVGESGVKVSFSWDIKVSDESNLRLLLGDKFDLLVKTETTFKPEKRLKELALSDDGLKECLEIKEKTPSVSTI